VKAPRVCKLLYVHSSNELYGADVVLLTLLRGLDKERFRPLVVLPCDVPYEGLLAQELDREGIPYVVYDTPVLRRKYLRPLGILSYALRLLKSVVWLASLIRREEIDVVHSNTSAVVAGALAARISGTPHVWHIHEIITEPEFLWKAISRLANALSKSVVAVSNPVAEHLVCAEPAIRRRTTVIHNGVDVNEYSLEADGAAVRGELGVAPNDVLVGMVGRIHRGKGQESLVRAAELISARPMGIKYVLVGDVFAGNQDRLAALRRQVERAGLGSRVIITGFRKDIVDVIAACDMVVMPSTHPEAFPTSVLEAMAGGKPIIATAHGGPTEMVMHGETGLLVPPGDDGALAEAIATLSEDEDARKAMGAAGRKRVEECFSISQFVSQFETLYDSVVDHSS